MKATTTSPRRRWLQFSLRSIIVLLTAAAACSLLLKGWLHEEMTVLSRGNTLVLEISADGSIQSGKETILDKNLTAAITSTAERIHNEGGDPEVMFLVAPNVKHNRIVEVMDLVSPTNFSALKFGVLDTYNNSTVYTTQNGVTPP